MPVLDGTDVSGVLEKLGVKFYVTPFEYVTPDGYFGKWRNQFYEFSIFKYISNHKDFNEEDRFLLLDSDCIITGDLSALFKSIEENKCITYVIDYNIHNKINGNSREDMKNIFSDLLDRDVTDYPAYHGGEIYASEIKVVKTLMEDFYIVWEQLLSRFHKGADKLNEEAHVLSYLFYKHNIAGGQANQFIKRLWTDPTTFRNIKPEDIHLLIWHLPAEKTKGFKKLFNWLQSKNFDKQNITKEMFQQRIQKVFPVPDIPFQQKPYYFVKSIAKKIVSLSHRN